MKSASAFVVPVATMLLLLTAASLGWQAMDAAEAASAAQSGVAQARREESEAAASLTALRGTVRDTPLAEPVTASARANNPDAVLVRTLAALHTQAQARQVSIDRIAGVGNTQQGYAGAGMLARGVPGTGGRIQAIGLQLTGGYTDYRDFKRFLADLTWIAAVQSFKVKADKFEAVVEIYGARHGV